MTICQGNVLQSPKFSFMLLIISLGARSIRPKFPEICGTKSSGTSFMETSLENFGQPLEVVLFPAVWKFRKFSVPLGISTQSRFPSSRLESLPRPKHGGERMFLRFA